MIVYFGFSFQSVNRSRSVILKLTPEQELESLLLEQEQKSKNVVSTVVSTGVVASFCVFLILVRSPTNVHL